MTMAGFNFNLFCRVPFAIRNGNYERNSGIGTDVYFVVCITEWIPCKHEVAGYVFKRDELVPRHNFVYDVSDSCLATLVGFDIH